MRFLPIFCFGDSSEVRQYYLFNIHTSAMFSSKIVFFPIHCNPSPPYMNNSSDQNYSRILERIWLANHPSSGGDRISGGLFPLCNGGRQNTIFPPMKEEKKKLPPSPSPNPPRKLLNSFRSVICSKISQIF